MIPRLISIQYFVMGNATLLVNNLVYIWVLTFFFLLSKCGLSQFQQKMEGRKFFMSHLLWVRELCHWEKLKSSKKVPKKSKLFLHCPTFCILWFKIYKLFSSLHCFKHYVKVSFMWKLAKICMSWVFKKWTKIQCSAAPHPRAFCSRFKPTNCCASIFSVEQVLLRLLIMSSHTCFQGCRYLPSKTSRFIAFHLWQGNSVFSPPIMSCSTLWIFLVGSLSYSAFRWS